MTHILEIIHRLFRQNHFDFDASLEIDRLIVENDALRDRIAMLESGLTDRDKAHGK